jgi:hypothetical protein
VFEGAVEKQRQDWQRAAYTGWLSGMVGRAAKPPKLEKILKSFEPRIQYTGDQIIEILNQMKGSK